MSKQPQVGEQRALEQQRWPSLPVPLWLCFFFATRHLLTILLPLHDWLPVMAAMLQPLIWLWPLDIAVVVVLGAGVWLRASRNEMAVAIWSFGRSALLVWHAVAVASLIVVHWQVLNDPDRQGFGALLAVLVVHLALFGYLLMSQALEDIFSEPLQPVARAVAVEPQPDRPASGATRLPPGAEAAPILRRCSPLRAAHAEIDTLCQALQAAPDDDLGWHDLALALLRVDALPQAVTCIERAVFLAPRTGAYHRNLGELYRRSGRLQDAMASAQQAVVLQPDDVDGHYNLGVILGDLARFKGAVDAYQRALALAPEHRAAWHNLAVVLDRLGEHDEAQAAAARAAELA